VGGEKFDGIGDFGVKITIRGADIETEPAVRMAPRAKANVPSMVDLIRLKVAVRQESIRLKLITAHMKNTAGHNLQMYGVAAEFLQNWTPLEPDHR
jgi:hypothetical protein